MDNIRTVPGDVTLYEPFDLSFDMRNLTSNIIGDLQVTYRGVDDDIALLPAQGSKMVGLPIPGSFAATTVTKGLRYLVDEPGVYQIELTFSYTYRYEGQTVARTQREWAVFRIAAPTPTPPAPPSAPGDPWAWA